MSRQDSHLGRVRSQRGDDVTAEVSDDAEAGMPGQAFYQLRLLHYGLPNTNFLFLAWHQHSVSSEKSLGLSSSQLHSAPPFHVSPSAESASPTLRHILNFLMSMLRQQAVNWHAISMRVTWEALQRHP